MDIPKIDSSFIKDRRRKIVERLRKFDKDRLAYKRDKNAYKDCVRSVKENMKQGEISQKTVEGILDWKSGSRKHLKRVLTSNFWKGDKDFWERFYAPRFRLILGRKLPEIYYLPLLVFEEKDFVRKLGKKLPAETRDALSKIKGKAKGFGVPVGSTFLHFLYPKEFPIIDLRTREMLYLTDKTKFIHADDPMEYESFRSAMLMIQKETGYDLHNIDIALFDFHEQELQPSVKEQYITYSKKLNSKLSEKEIGSGPNINVDPNFRRLLIDMIKYKPCDS